jgi:hypothetical protein
MKDRIDIASQSFERSWRKAQSRLRKVRVDYLNASGECITPKPKRSNVVLYSLQRRFSAWSNKANNLQSCGSQQQRQQISAQKSGRSSEENALSRWDGSRLRLDVVRKHAIGQHHISYSP